ncbi:MAG TPA: TIGR00730 family Rossman fold protein [Campylobacterales bacterium]|nr:TIGR00730 family Rossman fold protein [Campylobacterales bacterium]
MDINHIVKDFEKGQKELSDIGDSITIFGGSRFKEDSIYYQKAIEIGKRLSDSGYNIITGGSTGIMEASNKGAKLSGKTKSIGIHIDNLPFEQHPNKYLDKELNLHYFFTRKVMLINYSSAYIIMPGGFGTLDEFFEVLNLIRTKNHQPVPIVLFGSKYWGKLYEFMNTTMLEYETINQNDLKYVFLSDNIDEVVEKIKYPLHPKTHQNPNLS